MTPFLLAMLLGSQTIVKDQPYVTGGKKSQQLDLYIPANATKAPVVVYIHGGAFMFGDKKSDLMPRRLLDKGFAIASINYRLSGEAIFPAAVQDCKSAVRWLRANAGRYGLDPNRIVAWGESAGANLASMLGTTGQTRKFDVGENLSVPSAVQGVVAFYGPTDFTKMDSAALPGSQVHNSPNSPESKYVGGNIAEKPDLARPANPIVYIEKKTPPFFVAHGDQDHTVPYNQSELLVAALKKAGVPVTFHTVKGADHVFRGMAAEQAKALDSAVDAFLGALQAKPKG